MARSPREVARGAKAARTRAHPPPRRVSAKTEPSLARPENQLRFARTVLEAESRAILGLRERLGEAFVQAVAWMAACEGSIVVTGMGKSAFVAQKLSATLASTGIASIYLHPADAMHGDLGRVTRRDVMVALSNSGATEEIVRILPAVRRLGARIVAITGDPASALGKASDLVLDIGRIDEACPLGLVPTASTAALHAIGDALAMTLLKSRTFTSEEYALFHPGGKLGRSIMRVREVMRAGAANPVVQQTASLSEVVVVMTNTPGRPGAANVVNAAGELVGIFTDGDLRRLVERGQPDFRRPVGEVMGKRPRVVTPEELVSDAAEVLREARVDQVPVVDEHGKPVGLLDVQDLLASRFL